MSSFCPRQSLSADLVHISTSSWVIQFNRYHLSPCPGPLQSDPTVYECISLKSKFQVNRPQILISHLLLMPFWKYYWTEQINEYFPHGSPVLGGSWDWELLAQWERSGDEVHARCRRRGHQPHHHHHLIQYYTMACDQDWGIVRMASSWARDRLW